MRVTRADPKAQGRFSRIYLIEVKGWGITSARLRSRNMLKREKAADPKASAAFAKLVCKLGLNCRLGRQ